MVASSFGTFSAPTQTLCILFRPYGRAARPRNCHRIGPFGGGGTTECSRTDGAERGADSHRCGELDRPVHDGARRLLPQWRHDSGGAIALLRVALSDRGGGLDVLRDT